MLFPSQSYRSVYLISHGTSYLQYYKENRNCEENKFHCWLIVTFLHRYVKYELEVISQDIQILKVTLVLTAKQWDILFSYPSAEAYSNCACSLTYTHSIYNYASSIPHLSWKDLICILIRSSLPRTMNNTHTNTLLINLLAIACMSIWSLYTSNNYNSSKLPPANEVTNSQKISVFLPKHTAFQYTPLSFQVTVV